VLTRVGLVGNPVSHSLSPRMQNAAFATAGLDWEYVLLPAGDDELEAVVAGLRDGFAGANVTVPHKAAVIPFLDDVDDFARRADSVNTIVVRDGRLSGASTDGLAVVEAIEADGARVLMLGAGGAARAVATALEDAGATVRFATRRDPDWPPEVGDATVLVNATPVRDDLLVPVSPDLTVVDLAYRADGGPTALVEAAQAAGCQVVDGLEVLVRQGAASFERWTGRAAPVDVMRAALRR
jgi:shikimate dehydrogenase